MAGAAQGQESRREILLKDQFGKTDGPGQHHGQAVVLIYGKADGMRRMKAWEDGIRKQVPGAVVVVRGLDARSARGQKTEAELNERLQQVVPSDMRSWWTGGGISSRPTSSRMPMSLPPSSMRRGSRARRSPERLPRRNWMRCA